MITLGVVLAVVGVSLGTYMRFQFLKQRQFMNWNRRIRKWLIHTFDVMLLAGIIILIMYMRPHEEISRGEGAFLLVYGLTTIQMLRCLLYWDDRLGNAVMPNKMRWLSVLVLGLITIGIKNFWM